MGRWRKRRTVCAMVLCLAVAWGSFFCVPQSAFGASGQIFLPGQARNLALSNSSDYRKKYNQIILKNIKYEDAVRSVTEKRRNMSTFRWTPLLSFHFPEKPNLSEEMEFIFKPLAIKAEINNLNHGLADMKYEIQEKTDLAYAECYTGQEKAAFTEILLEEGKKELEKNRYRLVVGKASQNDIDVMEKSIKAKTSELSLQKRSFESAKKKLSDLTGMDVTAGYRFSSPFQTAAIPREALEDIIRYTLERDQSYYEAKTIAALGRQNLDTAQSLMAGRYGGNMGLISSYVSMSKQGKEVDTAAFQIAYNAMLQAVDSPWQGNKRILFIRIPREWFKGQIDGIRYVEDEPYALYTACLDYSAAEREKNDLEKSIRSQVSADYETIVTAKNAYDALLESVSEMEDDLSRLKLLNKQGKADYSEVKDKQSDYEATQMEALSALADYNSLLYSFDCLTCGAVTHYMKGEDLKLAGGGIADSVVGVDEEDYPYYYIESRVEDMKFVFGIHVPENFEPEITAFELWYGNTKVGGRTAADRQLSHLAIAAKNEENSFTVRLFQNDTYVEQCVIDPSVLKDRLNLSEAKTEEVEEEKVVASYRITMIPELKLTSLSIRPEESGIKYYSLEDKNGKALYSGEPMDIEDSFTYLSIMTGDLGTLRVKLYGGSKKLLYEGHFDTGRQKVLAGISQ